MSTKDQYFEQHITPLLDKAMELSKQGGINIVVVATYSEEGSTEETVVGRVEYAPAPDEKGDSVHIAAVHAVGTRPPEFALAVYKASELYDQVSGRAQLEREAAANPHGVAE